MSTVVVDKSYLRGARSTEVASLSAENLLVVTRPLLYEVMKEPPISRASLLRKFPDIEKPFELVENVGYFLRKEAEERRPSGHLSAHFRNADFKYHKDFIRSDYSLTDRQSALVKDVQGESTMDAEGLISSALQLIERYPDLGSKDSAEGRKEVNRLESLLAGDQEFVRSLYQDLIWDEGSQYPPPDHLAPGWVCYGWVQVQTMFAADLAARYGKGGLEGLSEKTLEKIRHDALDSEYLIVALSADGFATSEKKLIRWCKTLRPNGLLVEVQGSAVGG